MHFVMYHSSCGSFCSSAVTVFATHQVSVTSSCGCEVSPPVSACEAVSPEDAPAEAVPAD